MGRGSGRSWLKAAIGGLLLAGLALLLAWIDPFGLEKDSEKFSNDLAQYVLSPFYARGLGGDQPRGQRRVSVIYLDEDSLGRLYPLWTGFPPSYANQQELLETVISGAGPEQARPRAVFVDFVFLAKGRSGPEFDGFTSAIAGATRARYWADLPPCIQDEIAKLACIMAAGGVPVILGGGETPPPRITDPDTAEDGREALRKVAVLASLFVDERAYPLLAPSPAKDTVKPSTAAAAKVGDSPAALLYVAEQLGSSRPCRAAKPSIDAIARLGCAASQLVAGSNPAGSRLEMALAVRAIREGLGGQFAVHWSSRPDTASPGINDLSTAMTGLPSPCAGADGGGALKTWADAGSRFLDRLTRSDPTQQAIPGRAPICPYALSLSYGAWATGPSLSPCVLDRVFADRLVLVGGQFDNSSDWLASPVQGQTPGVQYHAMALDNLLEARGPRGAFDIPRFDKYTSILARGWSALLLFCLITIGGLHQIRRNDLRRDLGRLSRPDAWRLLRLYLRFLILDLAIILGSGVLALLFRMPVNWVAVGTIALGHALWSVREHLGEDLAPLTRRWPARRALRWLSEHLSLRHETFGPTPQTASKPIPPPPASDTPEIAP